MVSRTRLCYVIRTLPVLFLLTCHILEIFLISSVVCCWLVHPDRRHTMIKWKYLSFPESIRCNFTWCIYHKSRSESFFFDLGLLWWLALGEKAATFYSLQARNDRGESERDLRNAQVRSEAQREWRFCVIRYVGITFIQNRRKLSSADLRTEENSETSSGSVSLTSSTKIKCVELPVETACLSWLARNCVTHSRIFRYTPRLSFKLSTLGCIFVTLLMPVLSTLYFLRGVSTCSSHWPEGK
jgi:hypothetical protein